VAVQSGGPAFPKRPDIAVNLGIGNSGADYGARVTAGTCDQSPRLVASRRTAPVSSP